MALEPQIDAPIDWDDAVRSDTLTEVTVHVTVSDPTEAFAALSTFGTRIELVELTNDWDAESFRQLAQEIWSPQPPFDSDAPAGMRITLNTEFNDVLEDFSNQMSAIIDIWNARIVGGLLPPETKTADFPNLLSLPESLPRAESDSSAGAAISDPEARTVHQPSPRPDRILRAIVQIRDRDPVTIHWLVRHCEVDGLTFDVRVFDLVRRQPSGIKVATARSYLRLFGGVGIYDANFRLPYYGADSDWLRNESDVAARLTVSKLVPTDLLVNRGLLDLPSNANLFGRASVSTSHEQRVAGPDGQSSDYLQVQVTRDRLVDNAAYQRLRVMLRAPVDAYAMERARANREVIRPPRRRPDAPTLAEQFSKVERVLRLSEDEIPKATFVALSTAVSEAVTEAENVESRARDHAALLGALATAGITSLAYEHEISKQLSAITSLADQLDRISAGLEGDQASQLRVAAEELRVWNTRAAQIREIFVPLLDEEDRLTLKRFRAQNLLTDVSKQVSVLSHGTSFDLSAVPSQLRLPRGGLPGWSAIFQNLFINSFNALWGTEAPTIAISGGGTDEGGFILVSDNGIGVHLSVAEKLWEPFERATALPIELRDLGVGGTGLGLTIVRMIADELRVAIDFAEPPAGYSTSVRVSWTGARRPTDKSS